MPYARPFALLLAACLLSSCQGVAVSNRTSTMETQPSYDPQWDVFVYGAPSWGYELRVVRKSNLVDRNSIKPFVVVDGSAHAMVLAGAWNGNESRWRFEKESACGSPGSNPVSGLDYSFRVDYDRENIGVLLVKGPPARLPSSGTYSSQLLNLGIAFEPTAPYPNHGRNHGVIYDQNCWQTGLGCVPTWINDLRVGPWPGSSSMYEDTLRLVNPEPNDAVISDLTLAAFGSDATSHALFEVVSPNTAITVPQCGGTADITLRYKPGYEQDSTFTPGSYQHRVLLNSKIQWPGMANPVSGPSLRIDYRVSFNPS